MKALLHRIKEWLQGRDDGIEKEADLLMQLMGDKAHSYVYKRSRNMLLTEAERYHALKVRRAVEKKLGINGRVDTATRYLERE